MKLLQLALSQVDENYKIVRSPNAVSQSRFFQKLQQNQMIDVTWSMTSAEREQDFLAVRIPILKGLGGYRVLFIREQDRLIFAKGVPPEKIKRLIYGQVHDWLDTYILEANNFPVLGLSNYHLLFPALERGRIDAIPRNVLEIAEEYAALQAQARGIIIDANWLFYYPAPTYFFVNKANIKLAQDIEKGLRQLIADGRFEQLFNETYGESLKSLKLEERNIIRLENPFLSPETSQYVKEFWYPLITP